MDNQAMRDLRSDETRAHPNGRETASNGDGRRSGPDMRTGGDMVMRSVAGFGENLLTLAELQARLATVELRQNLDAARSGAVL